MFEELDLGEEESKRKSRLRATSRTRTPKSTRSTRFQKKTTGFGGSHRRRNKHWSW